MMNNENGRSMVEMLGVLAIIGVLSVAGIGGYSMAMKKYRANEILNAASQTIVLAAARYENNSTNATYTAAQAGYTGNIGGVAASSISADASAKTIALGVTDTDIQSAIKAASGCKIGEFEISDSGCTSTSGEEEEEDG